MVGVVVMVMVVIWVSDSLVEESRDLGARTHKKVGRGSPAVFKAQVKHLPGKQESLGQTWSCGWLWGDKEMATIPGNFFFWCWKI